MTLMELRYKFGRGTVFAWILRLCAIISDVSILTGDDQTCNSGTVYEKTDITLLTHKFSATFTVKRVALKQYTSAVFW
jgi:hypothetical protein